MNKLYKTLIYDKQVSLSVLETTDLVNRAAKVHNLSVPAAGALGQLLTCGAYMAGCLKSERGAVSITIKSGGGAGAASVSGDINLHMRGYIDGTAEGRLSGGFMTVVKEDGFFRPFTGACELISDDVSANMEHYFELSEQIPTRVRVGATFSPEGVCTAAGGVVMQLLPGHTQGTAAAVDGKMSEIGDVAAAIAHGGAEGIMHRHFGRETEEGHVYLTKPDYICNCSRKKISGLLLSMGKQELLNIVEEQGAVSVHCHYCNTDYIFGREDIEKLFT